MAAYYNENDPGAAAWLRELIARNVIAPGDVDERSIEDVRPDDLKSYVQCHFFAGIGVWSHALRLARWDDARPIWTGSCPCQPFSTAGKGGGFTDERHLWPAFYNLILALDPVDIVGEQVASKDGLAWLDLVSTDMENADYAFGAFDACAAGVGAPHIRQRSWWWGARGLECATGEGPQRFVPGGSAQSSRRGAAAQRASEAGRLDDDRGGGRDAALTRDSGGEEGARGERGVELVGSSDPGRPGPVNGFWGDADWLTCRDDTWRPVEPGSFPLAYGAPARMGRLRGYGNAIVAPLAATFIEIVMELRA